MSANNGIGPSGFIYKVLLWKEDKYMAGILSVDYEGAKDNVVTPIQTEIGNLAQAASEISRLMGELPNYWSGTSYDTADAKYHDEYQDFIEVKVPEIMGEFNQYMQDCLDKLKETDENLAR